MKNTNSIYFVWKHGPTGYRYGQRVFYQQVKQFDLPGTFKAALTIAGQRMDEFAAHHKTDLGDWKTLRIVIKHEEGL